MKKYGYWWNYLCPILSEFIYISKGCIKYSCQSDPVSFLSYIKNLEISGTILVSFTSDWLAHVQNSPIISKRLEVRVELNGYKTLAIQFKVKEKKKCNWYFVILKVYMQPFIGKTLGQKVLWLHLLSLSMCSLCFVLLTVLIVQMWNFSLVCWNFFFETDMKNQKHSSSYYKYCTGHSCMLNDEEFEVLDMSSRYCFGVNCVA